MNVLIISEPKSLLADLLMKSDCCSLICVTPEDVYVRNTSGEIQSGANINCPRQIEVCIPKIKEHLLKAYPLIDRWVSSSQSVSTTIGLMLEYTVTLIQIIGNHSPHVALLETGAPHHLDTYCLDVALNYLDINSYYLYGNGIDGRCLVVNGIKKKIVVRISDYSAETAINEYVEKIKNNATYVPDDSIQSLSFFLHKSLVYAIYLYVRYSISRLRQRLISKQSKSTQSKITLKFSSFKLFDVISIFNEHNKYRKLLLMTKAFQVSQIQSGDVVYVGHCMPEATNFPDSINYPDEIDVLIDLKNRFPESKIYYREHPAIELFSEFGHIHFQGLHKNLKFYEQIKNLGIEIVPPSMHISEIRKQGCLFATKTGRVAVENSILGISTIIYGYPFYGIDLPLTFHISKIPLRTTSLDIKALSSSIINPAYEVEKYLTNMFSGSIENPGISIGNNPGALPAFRASFISLVKHLADFS